MRLSSLPVTSELKEASRAEVRRFRQREPRGEQMPGSSMLLKNKMH